MSKMEKTSMCFNYLAYFLVSNTIYKINKKLVTIKEMKFNMLSVKIIRGAPFSV
jgi:hypothetical protein